MKAKQTKSLKLTGDEFWDLVSKVEQLSSANDEGNLMNVLEVEVIPKEDEVHLVVVFGELDE